MTISAVLLLLLPLALFIAVFSIRRRRRWLGRRRSGRPIAWLGHTSSVYQILKQLTAAPLLDARETILEDAA
jgi:hypothetical protein